MPLVRPISASAGSDRDADREHVTFTATVDVGRAKEHVKVTIDTEDKLDTIDAKKKREVIVKGVGCAPVAAPSSSCCID